MLKCRTYYSVWTFTMSIENSIESKPNQTIVDNMYTVIAQEWKPSPRVRRQNRDRTGPDLITDRITQRFTDRITDRITDQITDRITGKEKNKVLKKKNPKKSNRL